MIYMSLEMIAIGEGIFIGYAIFGDNPVFKALSVVIFAVLFTISYRKTKNVYERSCNKPKSMTPDRRSGMERRVNRRF